MYKVILFAGTVEGRTVAEYLNEHEVPTRVCVATEYGESLLPQGEYLQISHDRLTQEEMEELMKGMEDGIVIDATHPYAEVVTENIQSACQNTATAYMRVVRQETEIDRDDSIPMIYVKNIREAVSCLETVEGKILVTTGSKELASYTTLRNYTHRIYARVLSLSEVVQSCAALGIEGKHLICMQGPFSKEMNVALIRQFHISWIVSKESGRAGGFLEKYLAAKETGCGMIVIGRPKCEEGYSLSECLAYLDARWNLSETIQHEKSVEKYCAEEVIAEGEPSQSLEIDLVGIGMGTPDTLTVEGKRVIEKAQLLVGASRMLEQIKKPYHDIYHAYKADEICEWIRNHPKYHKVVVALSGDVGFYSGAKKLMEQIRKDLPEAKTGVHCGISSMIYFTSKLETSWEDAYPISLHGRERNVVGLLSLYPKIFAIVGDTTGIGALCEKLTAYGMGDTQVFVGERLSYPEERITKGTAAELTDLVTDALSVVLLERSQKTSSVVTHGIRDEEFIREKVPMTKEEVRSVSLSKLRLCRDSVIYDIGAGTGSVSVEMALQAVDGKVYAIEKKSEAAVLIRKNKRKFCADNLEVIQGEAPEACENLPMPTHAFIGGSSGNLSAILELLLSKNPKVRIVINCITLETVSEALEAVRSFSVEDVDIVQVTAARGKEAGPYHLMMGQNPVYIISMTGNAGDAVYE